MYIIEVGYASDLHHSKKVIQKQAQHAQLAAAMRRDGWTVHYDAQHIVTLGHGGTIPKPLSDLLTTLGATPHAAKSCCTRLHMHSVIALRSTTSLYYKLEREMGITNRRPGHGGQGAARGGPRTREPGWGLMS